MSDRPIYLSKQNSEKVSSQKMDFNKLTLAFPDDLERNFRKVYFQDSLIQFRISFVLVTILYGLFGYLDTMIAEEFAQLFHVIRFAVVIPLLLFVFLFSFSENFRYVWQELIFVCFIVGGVGITIMIIKAPENYTYYAGLMLIFSAGYFFIALRFLLAVIAGWTTLLLFNLGVVFYSDMTTELIISNNFFFISANLIGMFAAYIIELYKRRDFFLNQQLDLRNAQIVESNKNLQSKVDQRTKELVKSKEKAEESDRLKSAFLANMSHEIRTPMNGILGFAELLKGPGLTGEQQQDYIGIIEQSGARMLNIINDIVDISKIESGQMELFISETKVNELTEFIYDCLKLEAENKRINLSFKNNLPADEALIKTDRGKLYAILSNLVKNAIKYTDNGSIEFGVSTSSTTGTVSEPVELLQFYVKDTGIGIPIQRQKAIFERFIQADIIDKEARQGAGLGLAIAKAYVEMLGGKIWVESESGKGSVFHFTIPYYPKTDKKVVVKNVDLDNNNITQIKKLKILIAEDDEGSAKLLATVLGKISKEIYITRTGIETVEAYRNSPDIDLILMDIQMPEMNGYEATRQIREFSKNVIIIAQTAYALSGDKEKAMEAGCSDYISKPIITDNLLNMILKHVKQ